MHADNLKQFGLTENDSAVYIYLLERGTAFGGAKIASRLSLHRQYVYNSLDKLVELQLVEQVVKGVRPKFQALPPQRLTHLAKKRLSEAEDTVRELDLISAVGADQDFELYRGKRQIIDWEENFVHDLPQGVTQYIIGGGVQAFLDFYGTQYEAISSIARAKGLKTFYLASPADVPLLERVHKALNAFEYRVLPHMPTTTVQTAIRLDTVTFYSLGTPPLVYVLKSKSVYEDYKKFFDMLWNMTQ